MAFWPRPPPRRSSGAKSCTVSKAAYCNLFMGCFGLAAIVQALQLPFDRLIIMDLDVTSMKLN